METGDLYLAAVDPETGTITLLSGNDVCTARYVVRKVGKPNRWTLHLCGEPATTSVGCAPVCNDHYEIAAEHQRWLLLQEQKPNPYARKRTPREPTLGATGTAHKASPDAWIATRPPRIAIFDRAGGDYELTESRVCTARWESTNKYHIEGHMCGAEAVEQAGDVDLCQIHFDRIYSWRYQDLPLKELEQKTAALREADAKYRQAVKESAIHRERVDASASLVYYLRRTSDGMIKIGTTKSFRSRMSKHRADHGELQILLTHSGGRKEERQAHDRFATYRIDRSEWFYPARAVLRGILSTREHVKYGQTQQPGVLGVGEIRKLIAAAPADQDLKWSRGILLWPPAQAA